MVSLRGRLLVPLALLFMAGITQPVSGAGMSANPIRRVVTMLQMMQKKIEAEGKTEQELFDKFMCYCKNGVGSLVTSIKDAEDKVSQLEAGIEETSAQTKQLDSDVKKAKADRAEAEATLGKAKGLREKEADNYAKAATDSKTNIAAMGKAITALEKGMGAAFLQSSAAYDLKKLSIAMDISEADRDVLAAFLSNSQSEDDKLSYDPASGQITGILKQMKETMAKELSDATATEKQAIEDFESLTAAKEKQVTTLTKEIESKMVRAGEAGVELTDLQEDLDDTSKSLVDDKKFLVDVTKDCKTKEAQKEANDKMRTDELLALSETVKILNDDDALDLFKKTLPSPSASSFLQIEVTDKVVRQRALHALSRKRIRSKRDVRLNLISLALRGKKVSFDKVLKMIDEMSALLKKEQGSDDAKKAYCEKSLDETEDALKELEADSKDLEKAIASHQETAKTLASEIEALTTGIKDMDKQVAEATAQRKEEHADHEQTMVSDNAAKELLGMAKNRLSKFYSPKSYKAAPKRQLSEADAIAVNMGGTMAPTAAPGGIAGTGVTAAFAQYQEEADQEQASIGFLQTRSRSRAGLRMHAAAKFQEEEAPPPPPETAGAYKKAGEESTGVMAMIDMLMQDLTKEMTEMELQEKHAQEEYEELIEESAKKRADDSKSISDKEAMKVETEANALKMTQQKKGKQTEALAKMDTIQSLHSECDWLISNYDVRKEARADEVEQLTNAKAVLSGADYS